MSQYYIHTDIYKGKQIFLKDMDFARTIEFIKAQNIKSLEIVNDETDPAAVKLIITGSNQNGTESKRTRAEVVITDLDSEKPHGTAYEVEATRIYHNGQQLATGQEIELIDLLKYAVTNWHNKIEFDRNGKDSQLNLYGQREGHKVEIELFDLE